MLSMNWLRTSVLMVVVSGSVACAAADPVEEEPVAEQGEALTTACSRVCGDINNDGKVTVTDAVLANRIAAGLDTATPGTCKFMAADINRSGSVTVTDAVNIQRIAAGLPAITACSFGPITKIP